MQFTTAIASLLALALGATTAGAATIPIPRQEASDPHIIDFRTWSTPDCGASGNQGNQGVWTYTQSQLGTCFEFSLSGQELPQSLNLTDITSGCSLSVWSGTDCPGDATYTPAVATCLIGEMQSFKVSC